MSPGDITPETEDQTFARHMRQHYPEAYAASEAQLNPPPAAPPISEEEIFDAHVAAYFPHAVRR